ncbi:hypothetical protein EP7_004999 [Isosphaeraceae bacterium EP7]
MIEWLAIPAVQAPKRTLKDWAKAFEDLGQFAAIVPEPPGASWLEIPALGLRGFATHEESGLEAILFEMNAQDPEVALAALATAAKSLDWEIHEDDDDGSDDGSDDD